MHHEEGSGVLMGMNDLVEKISFINFNLFKLL